MSHLINFSLSIILAFELLTSTASSVKLEINDLLLPDISSMIQKINQKLETRNHSQKNIDEHLGPKDIFPFIPDNHRDSGTGKFNSF